jgi:hypothetical protein
MRKWLSLEEALKRFPNISTTWKIQRIQQVRCAIPVTSPRRKHQIQSHSCLLQNKLVERPNTSYMMKKLDPLGFGRQRHKSSLLPGPDLLLTLFINMIFERTFWVRILVWILFFWNFLWQIFRKSIGNVYFYIFAQDILFRDNFLIKFKKKSANLYSFSSRSAEIQFFSNSLMEFDGNSPSILR